MRYFKRVRDAIAGSWYGAILREHDTEPTEMFGGMMKLALAALLIAPADTFGSSGVYGLLSILPEPLWAVTLFAFGCLHLAALRHGNRRWRRLMALAGFLIWFCWSVSFWEGNAANTGGAAYGLLAVLIGWCYIRLGRPA